jgi:hypothetical protein
MTKKLNYDALMQVLTNLRPRTFINGELGLIRQNIACEDSGFAYVIHSIDFNIVKFNDTEMSIHDKRIASILSTDFSEVIANNEDLEFFRNLQHTIYNAFIEGETQAATDFNSNIQNEILPFTITDDKVVSVMKSKIEINKLLVDIDILSNNCEQFREAGYRNGTLWKITMSIMKHPHLFLHDPEILHRVGLAQDSKALTFASLFVSPEAFVSACSYLKEEFVDDKLVWIYDSKFPVSTFFAMIDTLSKKRYLHRYYQPQEKVDIAAQNFDLKLSLSAATKFKNTNIAFKSFVNIPDFKKWFKQNA